MKQAPVRHALEHALFLPFAGLCRALPHIASRRLGRGLGALAYALDRSHRRIAAENLAAAIPEIAPAERSRIVAACFRHFGGAFADALSSARFDRVALCRRLELVGLDRLLEAEARGQGVVLVTAHYSAWEIAPQAIAQAAGPVVSVGRPIDNPHVDRTVRALRERFGNRVVDKRGAVREMFRVLAHGGRLGLLIDQRVRAEEAIDVPFFGRPALTSPIVARLALRTGAPVVPLFADPTAGGGYRVEFLEPLQVEATGDGEAVTFALTRRVVEICERVIRAAPERWLWMHRRWKH